MSPVIRIPENIYSRLEQHAKGFDTPAKVIETLLDYFEDLDTKASNMSPSNVAVKKRDSTKYLFKKQQYGKRRLVLAVIKDFVAHDLNTTFENLEKKFPKHLQGSIGVFNELKFVQKKYENQLDKRHFMKDIIRLKDCDIVVCTQWGVDNINIFVEQADCNGCSISPISG